MTMFSKGTWTVFTIESEEEAFKTKLVSDGFALMPTMAKSESRITKGHALGIAPFHSPRLGDVEEVMFEKAMDPTPIDALLTSFHSREWLYNEADNTISDTHGSLDLTENELWDGDPESWKIADGVYALWFVNFDWEDVHDMNSKKEALAYSYGSPFKFQPAEAKKQISEAVEDPDTIVRKQYQVIIDFNLKRVWFNSASKNAVIDLMAVLASLDVPLLDYRPEEDYGISQPQWTETFLRKLIDKTVYQDEFNARAAEIKLHGVQGVEPNESPAMEKILKNFFAFTPMDDSNTEEFLAFGGPLSVRLAPTVASTVALRTPYEATELLNDDNQELLLSSAPMTFCRLFDKTTANGVKKILVKDLSIEVTSTTSISECPGFIVKGLNLENFKHTLKQYLKENDNALEIKNYWQMWYYGMNTSLFRYLNLVKEVMEN